MSYISILQESLVAATSAEAKGNPLALLAFIIPLVCVCCPIITIICAPIIILFTVGVLVIIALLLFCCFSATAGCLGALGFNATLKAVNKNSRASSGNQRQNKVHSMPRPREAALGPPGFGPPQRFGPPSPSHPQPHGSVVAQNASHVVHVQSANPNQKSIGNSLQIQAHTQEPPAVFSSPASFYGS